MLQLNVVILRVHHLLALPFKHITSVTLDRILHMAVLTLDPGPHSLVQAPVLLLESLAEGSASNHAGSLDNSQPGKSRPL